MALTVGWIQWERNTTIGDDVAFVVFFEMCLYGRLEQNHRARIPKKVRSCTRQSQSQSQSRLMHQATTHAFSNVKQDACSVPAPLVLGFLHADLSSLVPRTRSIVHGVVSVWRSWFSALFSKSSSFNPGCLSWASFLDATLEIFLMLLETLCYIGRI